MNSLLIRLSTCHNHGSNLSASAIKLNDDTKSQNYFAWLKWVVLQIHLMNESASLMAGSMTTMLCAF